MFFLNPFTFSLPLFSHFRRPISNENSLLRSLYKFPPAEKKLPKSYLIDIQLNKITEGRKLAKKLKHLGLAQDPNKFSLYRNVNKVSLNCFYPCKRRLRWRLKLTQYLSRNNLSQNWLVPHQNLPACSTISRYLHQQWRVYTRLHLERYLSQQIHARVYISLHNIMRALHTHPNLVRIYSSCFFIELEPKRLAMLKSAKAWGWSFYQIEIISISIFFLLTVPNSSSLVLLILKHLLQKNRKHIAVVRFFTGQLNNAIEKLDEKDQLLVSYRLYLSGRIGGGLRKKKLRYANNPFLHPLKIQIPISINQTSVVTKYGSIGIKFWLQIFPIPQKCNDHLYQGPNKKLRV